MARKRKFKVHYDRLIVQLLLLGVFVFVGVWAVSQCRSDEALIGRDTHYDAVETGRHDAEKVLNTHPGSMQRDEALLFIRARENELRSNGHGHAADDYINSAKKILEEHGIK